MRNVPVFTSFTPKGNLNRLIVHVCGMGMVCVIGEVR